MTARVSIRKKETYYLPIPVENSQSIELWTNQCTENSYTAKISSTCNVLIACHKERKPAMLIYFNIMVIFFIRLNLFVIF